MQTATLVPPPPTPPSKRTWIRFDGTTEAALVSGRASRVAPRIDGRAAGYDRVRPRRAAIVLEEAEEWVGPVEISRP